MRTPRARIAARVLALACAAGLGGCYGDGLWRSPGGGALAMMVRVREAGTERPIGGAVVIADVPSRDHPFNVPSILGETALESARGVTDAQGVAQVSGLSERPVRLTVFAEGAGGPVFVLLDPNPADEGVEKGWVDLIGVESGGEGAGAATRGGVRLQARVERTRG